MRSRRTSGFTLVEIMLVVAILGILVSVALPRLSGRAEEARLQAARLQIESLAVALETFELDCGRLPSGLEGLAALKDAPAVAGWKGPYLKRSVPLDPWKRPYVYAQPGASGRDYDLSSAGPDGTPGTADDVGGGGA